MTKKWPTVSGKYRRTTILRHAQAWAGNPELHDHKVVVGFGWSHEMNPHHGHTWSVFETEAKVEKLCTLVDGKNFNDLIPPGTQPTVETLACWLLVRAPAFYTYVEIDAYDGYTVRVDRDGIPAHWRKTSAQESTVESLTV